MFSVDKIVKKIHNKNVRGIGDATIQTHKLQMEGKVETMGGSLETNYQKTFSG